MIRGIGEIFSSTYSQTLNAQKIIFFLIELVIWMEGL